MKLKLFIMLIAISILSACGCDTKECIDGQIQLELIKQNSLERVKQYELDKIKTNAEIESKKPIEVRVQEAKNEESTIGESAVNAAAIGAGAYVGVKLLDTLFN